MTLDELERLAKADYPCADNGYTASGHAQFTNAATPKVILQLITDLKACAETVTYALDMSTSEMDRIRFREALQNLKKWGIE